MGSAEIAFEDVNKVYPDGTRAVSDMSLVVQDGEFMVFVGPSGCGKTTALRMVAGLEDITSGTIRIGERVINHVPAKDRDIAMVFQSYALYPHMTVFDNMGFGLRLRKVPKDEIRRRVEGAARMLGLDELLGRKPRALSGGQRQRVAMGRAIVRAPQAFLMDEPLSNLDAKLRVQMRAEISGLQQELRVTTIYVTHDQIEAMTMGHRVAVIRRGELQQVAPPQELYDRPRNLFVGGFIGSPAMNMLMATVEKDGEEVWLRLADHRLPVRDSKGELPAVLARRHGSEVVCGIRPEDLDDSSMASQSWPRLPGEVKLREPLGSEIVLHVEVSASQAVTEDVRELAADVDDGVAAEQLSRRGQATLVARFDPRSQVRVGDRLEMAVDTSRIHVFDPQTGRSIREEGSIP